MLQAVTLESLTRSGEESELQTELKGWRRFNGNRPRLFRIGQIIAFSFVLASCVSPSNRSLPSRDIGQRPAGWTGGDYKKNGTKVGSVWLSPDKGQAFVQQARILRNPTEGVDDIVGDLKHGHTIDSVRHYRVNGLNVADVRCRPIPKPSRLSKFTRFLIFEGPSSFDSFMFSGVSKGALNRSEFKQMYRRLGVEDY